MTIVFILFLLLAAIVLLPSQLADRKEAIKDVQESLLVRMEQLKKDFQFRTKELARRLQSEDLADDEWQKLSDELGTDTRAAIDSTQIATETHKANVSLLTAFSIMILVAGIAFIVYQVSGSYDQVKQQQKISNQLKTDPKTIDNLTQMVQSKKSSDALDNLYLALRTKVELLPSNIYSWRELAFFNASYGRMTEAKAAMNIALDIEPNNVDLKIDLANILTQSKDKKDLFSSLKLIGSVLQQQPYHESALLLRGISLFQFGMYKGAIDSWKKLLENSNPSPSMLAMVEKRIKSAEQLITGKQGQSAHSPATIEAAQKPVQSPSAMGTAAKLIVNVQIPDSVRSGLTGEESLFIFVKAVGGPRFPIAVVRTKVADLTGEIVLTDANAMRPEFALSKFDNVKVKARISFSNNAIATSGDIEGETDIIKAPFPTSPVTVVLNNVKK